MYFLLKLLLLSLVVSGVSWGNDISSLPLIEPIPYARDAKFGQGMISKTGVFAGSVWGINIGNLIKDKIEFPSQCLSGNIFKIYI